MAAFVLARHSVAGAKLIAALAPAGRIALSNYLFQSIVLSVLFTGYGLALVGDVSPFAAVLIAVAVFAVQTFEESLKAEKTKKDLLEKKFHDALKRTKDAPLIKPIRDIDLD